MADLTDTFTITAPPPDARPDRFIINDIELSVPPTEISVQREATNFEWQTLRTVNSVKVKSGHGVIHVAFTTLFVGPDAINNQLRSLICQLRQTPICYVENEYLSGQILLQESTQDTLMLILKTMSITMQPDMKDTAIVHFEFGWFNYKPYVDNISFKQDINTNASVPTPSLSAAWSKFAYANIEKYNIVPSSLVSKVDFNWYDFKLQSVGNQEKAGAINLQDDGFKSAGITYESDVPVGNHVLLRKQNLLTCNADTQLIPVGVTVLFKNIVSALPVLGHQYATYQYMGSIDPKVYIRLLVPNEKKETVLQMWNSVENSAIKFRHLPQENLNLTVSNDIINLCGLQKFITDELSVETIPGQPGTSAITIGLQGTDYTIKETLTPEFVTYSRVRDAILNDFNKFVVVNNISPIPVIQPLALGPGSERFVNLLKKYCDICNLTGTNAARQINFGIIGAVPQPGIQSPEVIQARDIWKFFVDDQPVPPQPTYKAIQDILVQKFQTAPINFIGPTNFNTAVNGPNYDNFLAAESDGRSIKEVFPEIVHYLEDLRNLLDTTTIDGSLDLPQLEDAKVLADQLGAFQGHSAYPDISALSSIETTEGRTLNSLDPDFYFSIGVTNGLASYIDAPVIKAAQDFAERLYTNRDDGGDWWNQISNFVEDIYKNRFVKNTLLRTNLETDWHKNLKDFFGSNPIADISKAVPPTATTQWQNWLGTDGANINAYTFNKPIANLLPSSSEPIKCTNDPIIHFSDFESFTASIPDAIPVEEATAMGIFIYPILSKITSHFGERAPITPAPGVQAPSTNHTGIDLRAKVGTPVKATMSGVISKIFVQTNLGGLVLEITHPNKWTSIYAHLHKIAQKFDSDTGGFKDLIVGDNVVQGQPVAFSGGDPSDKPNAGDAPAPHLHFALKDPDGNFRDPEPELEKSIITSTSRDVATQQTTQGSNGLELGSSLLSKSVQSLQDDLASGQAQRMVRAYPTFKLYFIDEHYDEVFLGYDNFFNYNSVKSIRVVRSRKVPADLCVLELTNISGILTNRKFQAQVIDPKTGLFVGDQNSGPDGLPIKPDDAILTNPLSVNTGDNNPLSQLMIKEGTRILLKLGYASDPNKLDTVFVGQVTEVEISDTDDLINIVCQSYTTELTQQIKGTDQPITRSGLLLGLNGAETGQLLSDLIASPEVLHFGRWRRSITQGLDATNTNLDLLNNKFEWNPQVSDDNIFPPVVDYSQFQSLLNTGASWLLRKLVLNTSAINILPLSYAIYKTTIWDVFKEMELRHPGCIASAVPYIDAKRGPRMTMFFGQPWQLYFARDPSLKETANTTATVATVKNGLQKGTLIEQLNDPANTPITTSTEDDLGGTLAFTTLAASKLERVIANYEFNKAVQPAIDEARLSIAIKNGSIKPFRNYHVLTSKNHILSNNIRASSLGVFNTASIEYSDGPGFNSNSKTGFSETQVDDGGMLISTKPNVFTLKADAGLPDEVIQECYLQYPNCEGEDMARYYALGVLRNTLRDIYKGELTIIGSASIKPYDICYIFDEYTDMIGPVEVKQVVHLFSHESGFVTEIQPDICIGINEQTQMPTIDALGMVAENVLSSTYRIAVAQGNAVTNTANAIVNTGISKAGILGASENTAIQAYAGTQTAPVAGVFFVGIFGAYKAVQWSQFRHPITLAPLMYKGRPFIAAMASHTVDASWWTKLGNWFKNGYKGSQIDIKDLTDWLHFNPQILGNIINAGLNDKGL